MDVGRLAQAVSPFEEDIILYSQISNVYKSNNSGANWSSLAAGHHDDKHWINFGENENIIWIATDGGINKTEDGGISWINKTNNIGVANMFNIGSGKINPNLILYGGYDTGTSLCDTEEDEWHQLPMFGDSFGCGIDDTDRKEPPVLYWTNQNLGHFFNRSTDGGHTCDVITPGASTGIGAIGWEQTFAMDYYNRSTLYLPGRLRIGRTTDRGDSWQAISPLAKTAEHPNRMWFKVWNSINYPDYLYAIRINSFWQDYDYEAFRLFKSVNCTATDPSSVTWIDVTPVVNNVLQERWIKDVAVDEMDPDKLWVCYSGFKDNDPKVIYFDGNEWSDLTGGTLSPLNGLSVLSIEHQLGSESNLVYIGTNAGVFYRSDDQPEWTKLHGIPHAQVMELEISYCARKLRAATFGRGLWETDLIEGFYQVLVDNDETWDNHKLIMSNVIIPDGVTLTITGTVELSEYSKIIIERRGKLILDGGTLTSACAGMWKGIEVWGTATTTQNPIDQGWVKIINGGTIKNAVCGIRAVKMSIPQGDGEEAPDYYYTGGIIQASDAHFINNQTAVQFYNYSYNSVSYFVNCEFKLDGNYFGTTEPENYMVVDNMTGVRVTFCEFLNEKTEDAEYTGILSENSTIYLEGDCIAGSPCTAWENGTFENLEYGIYANAATTSRHVDIRHTNFVNNYRGIYIGGMTSPRVTSNKFYLNRPATDHGYGLYLDRSTGYWVEDNLFEKTPGFGGTDPLGIGIVVNESGRNPNQIYLNTFNYVEYAINVQGQNRHGKISSQGLVIKCNDYNETAFDETIIWNAPVGSSEAGIARSQGLGTLNIGDMAGNIFHYQTNATDYDDINNTSNIIDYYYSSNALGYNVEPMDAQFLVTVWKHGMGTLAQWTPEAACLSAINPGGGGGGTGTVEYRADMDDAQEGIETSEAVLAAMVDGGDTEALNTKVETSTPPEAIQVYNELMSVSPNLSETVVESSIEKENVLPNAMVRDVMVANPHTSKSLVLLEKLDDRFDPMPDYMKAQILAGRSIQTLKQELEEQLAGYQLKKTIAMDNIIRYYQEQLEPQVASDSIVALYQSDHTLNSSYRLAWLYLERGEYQNGESVLNNIPNKFTLDETEQLEYNQIFSIYTMLAGLYENGNTIASLTENQISQLQTLEAEGTLTAQVYARNILLALDEIEYNEPVLFPDFTKSSQAIEEYGKLINTKPPQMLEVYPNPSSGYVIIEYNLEKAEGCKIEISGMTGKTIQTLATSGKQDQITVVTENWKPGTYIATLFIDGKVIESCKFTIIK